jgi:hypothetical protein
MVNYPSIFSKRGLFYKILLLTPEILVFRAKFAIQKFILDRNGALTISATFINGMLFSTMLAGIYCPSQARCTTQSHRSYEFDYTNMWFIGTYIGFPIVTK